MDNMKLNMQYTGYARHMWNRIFLFACLVAISVCAIAQEKGKSVTGTVTDNWRISQSGRCSYRFRYRYRR